MFGLMRARTCARHTEPWRQWRNHYCGTCKTIGARYGQVARMALNHDTVFLGELLTALGSDFERSAAYRSFNCMSLPGHDVEMPVVLRYAAAATLVLAEFKVIDHIEDTGRRRWRALERVFSLAFRKAERDLLNMGFPFAKLRDVLGSQTSRERMGVELADFSAPTAEATAMFFEHGAAVIGFKGDLVPLGRKFGELAYLLDAFEDHEKDLASGGFNALRATGQAKGDVVPRLQRLVEEIGEDLRVLPLHADTAAAFIARLKTNVDSKLGLHICKPTRVPRERISCRQRWEKAIEFARGMSADAPMWRAPLTVGAVAIVAYLAPAHSKAATTPAECLSLGFNLMALGSMFAMAASGDPPPVIRPVDPSVHPTHGAMKGKSSGKGSGGGGCGNCGSGGGGGCDACDCCCCCESIECCSGCGDCCGSCGECGDCCGSCSCDC